MSGILVSCRGLGAQMAGRRALHGIDLDLRRGEIVTVVGPNGSGKSTLMKVIVGSVAPSEGRIERAPGLSIGYVPQALHLGPGLPITVARFLSLPRRGDAGALLARTGADGLERRQMTELSGGQLQRVMLARALAGEPDLLILDEATRGLDQPGSAAFYRLVEAARAQTGCAVLMVSHELHVVMAASDRVICLNGHVCCEGAPDVVAQAAEYRALFGTGTGGALALYRHRHDHGHDHGHHHGHDHDPGHARDQGHGHAPARSPGRGDAA